MATIHESYSYNYAYEFDRQSVDDARGIYPNLWRTAKHNLPTLTDEQVAIVVSLVVGTCPSCHDAEVGCYCTRDD